MKGFRKKKMYPDRDDLRTVRKDMAYVQPINTSPAPQDVVSSCPDQHKGQFVTWVDCKDSAGDERARHGESPPSVSSDSGWSISTSDIMPRESPSKGYHCETLNRRNKVIVSGVGIEGGPDLVPNELTQFKISTKRAGDGEITISIRDPEGKKVAFDIQRQLYDYECWYKPLMPGKYKISVSFRGINLTGSPFTVTVHPELLSSHFSDDNESTFSLTPFSNSGSSPSLSQISSPTSSISFPPELPTKRRPSLPNFINSNPGTATAHSILEDLELLRNISPITKSGLQKCLISVDNFQIGNALGEGHFGVVYEARITVEGRGARVVAVKGLKDPYSHKSGGDLEEFFHEPLIMKSFKHENILELIGVIIHKGSPFIALPLMKNGNMRTFLEKNRKVIREDIQLSFCLQTARGMEYLSNLKMVHRDLAARNCMLDDDLIVKVSDFGMTRDTLSDPYVMMTREKPMPVRWMAPEINQNLTFNTSTDVWAFGVVLWEIFTCGAWPYRDVPEHLIFSYLKQGNRLDKPENMNEELNCVMHNCWNAVQSDRPTFGELVKYLNQQLDECIMRQMRTEQGQSSQRQQQQSGPIPILKKVHFQ